MGYELDTALGIWGGAGSGALTGAALAPLLGSSLGPLVGLAMGVAQPIMSAVKRNSGSSRKDVRRLRPELWRKANQMVDQAYRGEQAINQRARVANIQRGIGGPGSSTRGDWTRGQAATIGAEAVNEAVKGREFQDWVLNREHRNKYGTGYIQSMLASGVAANSSGVGAGVGAGIGVGSGLLTLLSLLGGGATADKAPAPGGSPGGAGFKGAGTVGAGAGTVGAGAGTGWFGGGSFWGK